MTARVTDKILFLLMIAAMIAIGAAVGIGLSVWAAL
jgi:hypothetical protein